MTGMSATTNSIPRRLAGLILLLLVIAVTLWLSRPAPPPTPPTLPELHQQLQTGTADAVLRLLDERSFDRRQLSDMEQGATPLRRALERARRAESAGAADAEAWLLVVDSLLDAGAEPDTALSEGETLLHHAADWGRTEVIERLLAHGARVDHPDATGRTALMRATAAGQPAATATLLTAGADVDRPDQEGKTALEWARDYEVAWLIVQTRINARRAELEELEKSDKPDNWRPLEGPL